jgi:uncharacterized protein (TIGR03067 family)
MKRCPKCNLTYQDDDLNFCLTDGGQLVFVPDSEETVIRPSPFLQQTSPSVRQGFNPIFVYLTIGLLALFAGGAIMLWLKSDLSITPTANNQTPNNLSNSTPSVQKDDDKKLLQDLWQLQYVIDYSGVNSLGAETKYHQFLFKEDKFILKGFTSFDSSEECDYKIDSTKSPKQLDIRRPSQSKPVLAIYEINNDELKVCLERRILHRPPKDFEMERPKNFDVESNSDLAVYVLKRVK